MSRPASARAYNRRLALNGGILVAVSVVVAALVMWFTDASLASGAVVIPFVVAGMCLGDYLRRRRPTA